MYNPRYHSIDDGTRAAQSMLDELDSIHYGICRLHHDHKDDGIGSKSMGSMTSKITALAFELMAEFTTIETITFNRDWFNLMVEHKNRMAA